MAAPLVAGLLKGLAGGASKKALMGAAKQGAKSFLTDKAKDKAKDFVTGKNRKKKGKKGALVKSKGGEVTQGGELGSGGALVATTPMVGNYRVETPPDKPDTEGKPSQVSFESINNQLESIAGLTEVLKKTSQAKLKTSDNRRKAERKAREKAKKRQRENLLEKGAGFIGGKLVDGAKKAAPFDPLKFFTMIFLGSLLMWVVKNGSKIIAALKITLAFINNLPKLMMAGFNALRKGFGFGLKLIGKLSPRLAKIGKSVRNIFKAVGSKISKAFRSIGKGIANLAKGIIKKLKALGKFMMKPFGGKKPPKGTPKGIEKTAKDAAKSTTGMTNDAKRILKKHGPEAAERYQRLVDKGMDPAKASRQVNKAVKAGKIASQPAKAGSKVAQKAGQKSILKVTKKGLGFLRRIPVVGSLLTLVVSLLGGDPISQALFKTGGAGIGGFLGTFIPIPVVGTVLGELIGEYVGDLFYHLIMGGGPEAVGQKLQDDIKSTLETGSKIIGWVGDGFKRMYEGLPKIKFPLIPFEVVNFPALLLNPLQIVPTVYKAFFTRDPMGEGEVEQTSSQNQPTQLQTGVVTPTSGPGAAPPNPYSTSASLPPPVPQGPGRLAGPVPSGGLQISNVKTTYYDPSLGGINASGAKTAYGLPATSTGEAYLPQVFSAAAFPPLIAQLPSSMTVPTADPNWGGIGRTIKKPFHMIVTNGDGKKAIIRVNDVGPGVAGHSSNHMLDLSVAAKDYLGTGGGFTIQMAPPNSKSGPLTSKSQTPSQVQPQTPVAQPPVKVQPGAPAPQSHPSVPAVPGVGDDKGALKTGLVTGPSAYIGGSAEYHIDTQIMKSVPMRQKIAMVDQMAMGYDAQGRVMEFSNSGVAGETWNVNASYDEKVKLLERVFAAHSHSMYADRNSMDYYIPKKGHNRRHSSAEGAEILAPTVGGTSASYASGGGYGNFVEIKDSKGQVIARTGHGDSRVGGGQGTVSLDGSRQIASSAVPGASITPPPAAVRPPTETTSPVPSISQSLAYETTGSTVVMMTHPSNGGGVSLGGGGSGTPVIMGSGDVVNSYYKSQLLGFLYKQG